MSSSLQSPFTLLPMFASLMPGCANSTKLNSQLAAELARQLQLRRSSLDSDPDSMSAGGSSTEIPLPGQLKATDSLLLLNQLEATTPLLSKCAILHCLLEFYLRCTTVYSFSLAYFTDKEVFANESDTDSNEVSNQKALYTRSLGTEADEEEEDEEDDEELDEEAAEREANQLVIEVSARELTALTQSKLSVRENSCTRPMSPLPKQSLQPDLTQARSRLSLDMDYLPIQPRMVRSESSFGLHSPADEIKALPSGETFDIIDLTAIPPPPEPGPMRTHMFTPAQSGVFTSSVNSSAYEIDNIDRFIASLSVPPPSIESHLNEHLDVQDLIVIPPPPSVQPFVDRQDQLLNRFRKATEDMKRICKQPSGLDCGNDSTSLEPSYKENLKSLSVTNKGKNPGRDLNSASSADSGYESVIVNHSIQVPADSPSLISFTGVMANDFSSERFQMNDDRRDYANVIRPLMAKPPKAPPRRVDSLSSTEDGQSVFNLALNELRRLQEIIKSGSAVDQATREAGEFRQELLSIIDQHSEKHWAESLATLRALNNEISNNELDQLFSSSIATREALITSCRQFVTSSKLFVKSATEHADPLLPDHLSACVLQLQRICQLVLLLHSFNSSSDTLVQNLVRVLRTYAFTVQTVGQLRSQCFDSVPQSSQLNLLMEHATELASALSVLMKSFRD